MGLDDVDFDSSGFEDAEEIYSKRKDELLAGILSFEPEEAKEPVQAEYDAVRECHVSGDSKPYFVVSDSEQLTEYYEARDSDTAERLRQLVISERRKKGSKDTAIVYLCNISHFDDGYQNLVKNLEDLGPEKMLMCDAERPQ